MSWQKGQSLIELLIALGIFFVAGSALVFFILDSYVSGRLTEEITVANFLAQEGIEATRSIRDNQWTDLATGEHGLIISGDHWVFFENQEDVSDLLKGGIRKIIIEELDPVDGDRKKVTSKVSWEFTPDRLQEVKLTTYFTDFSKTTPYLRQLYYRWRNDDGGE